MLPAMTWLYVAIASVVPACGSLAGAGLLLPFPRAYARLKGPLLAYAVGTLLAAALIALLPEALAEGPGKPVLGAVLAGFVGFFLLEKVLRLPHVHAHESDGPGVRPAATLILVGDAFHNLVDGMVIGTAFAASPQLGLLAALATVAHEIPQELGDFVVLLESGMERRRAYVLNFMVGLVTLPAALAAYAWREAAASASPYLLAVASASFLYIAATDLAPVLHQEAGRRANLVQAASLGAGIATIALVEVLIG